MKVCRGMLRFYESRARVSLGLRVPHSYSGRRPILDPWHGSAEDLLELFRCTRNRSGESLRGSQKINSHETAETKAFNPKQIGPPEIQKVSKHACF